MHHRQDIYPDEIVDVLCSHPNVEDALIKKHEGLKAFVLLVKPCALDTLLEHCRKRLPAHKVPNTIEVCQDLPYRWKGVIAQNKFDILG